MDTRELLLMIVSVLFAGIVVSVLFWTMISAIRNLRKPEVVGDKEIWNKRRLKKHLKHLIYLMKKARHPAFVGTRFFVRRSWWKSIFKWLPEELVMEKGRLPVAIVFPRAVVSTESQKLFIEEKNTSHCCCAFEDLTPEDLCRVAPYCLFNVGVTDNPSQTDEIVTVWYSERNKLPSKEQALGFLAAEIFTAGYKKRNLEYISRGLGEGRTKMVGKMVFI